MQESRTPPTQTLEDLRAAQGGDREAADRLWLRYYEKLAPKVRRGMGSKLRQKVETYDILQSVFLEAVSAAGDREFRSERHFHSWLNRLVESRLQRKARFFSQQRRSAEKERPLNPQGAVEPPPGPPQHRPISLVEKLDDEERVERALEQLPSGQREVLVLRFYEQLSFAEIGERIGRSEEAARKLVNRAVELLSAELGEG